VFQECPPTRHGLPEERLGGDGGGGRRDQTPFGGVPGVSRCATVQPEPAFSAEESVSALANPGAPGHITDEQAVRSHAWSVNPVPRGKVKRICSWPARYTFRLFRHPA
jgi:hypothetical protein